MLTNLNSKTINTNDFPGKSQVCQMWQSKNANIVSNTHLSGGVSIVDGSF